MDPEAGGDLGPGLPGIPGGSELAKSDPSVIQRVLRALIQRLGLIASLVQGNGKEVGRKNRFYFDEATQQWKLENETEQDRLEAEAIRFHTCRGMSTIAAPSTTSSDTSRGAHLAPEALAPPPTGGPVTMARHAGAAPTPSWVDAAMCHPVEAPHGLGLATGPPPPGPPPAGPPQSRAAAAPSSVPPPASAPLANPFGSAPLQSPFGAQIYQAAAPLSSPFGQPPVAPTAMAATPLAAPFGHSAPALASVAASAPEVGALQPNEVAAPPPFNPSPLAAPFGQPAQHAEAGATQQLTEAPAPPPAPANPSPTVSPRAEAAAHPSPEERLSALEEEALGERKSGALLPRIEALEDAVLGQRGSGKLGDRLQALASELGH